MMALIDIVSSAGLWAAVLRIATPLIFGTLGAMLCERAGVLNLGIEGIMTFGAMIGWLAVFHGADLWTGLLVAAFAGAIFGLMTSSLRKTSMAARSTPPQFLPFPNLRLRPCARRRRR